MPLFRRSLAAFAILLPAAAMLSLGCGLFTLPVVGPKAVATNAKYIHFTVEITDDTGAPLPDVQVQVEKYSMDNNLFFGEVDKSDGANKTASGKFEYSDFGHYAVALTFSKEGFGPVRAVYANADSIHHSSQPFGSGLGDETAHNVQKSPQQHVILSKGAPGAPHVRSTPPTLPTLEPDGHH